MLLVLFLATLVAKTAQGFEPIITNQIHLIRPEAGSGRSNVDEASCLSWRLAVETNNLIDWITVPEACEGYVGNYMLRSQYKKDSQVVTNEAYLYAKSLRIPRDGRSVWVFNVDEVALSNLPYYARHGFGTELYNSTAFTEWMEKAEAPAQAESLELYNKLLPLGIKVVFLASRNEKLRNVTATNLKSVGYHTWEKLLLW